MKLPHPALHLLSLVLSLCVMNVDAAQIAARVYVTPDADVSAIRTSLLARGATIRDFLPEAAFLIFVDEPVQASLSQIAGVMKVESSAPPSSARRARAAVGVVPIQVAGSVVLTPEETQQRDAAAGVKPTPLIAPSALALRRAAALGTATRGSAVDNSLSMYFPPIGDQMWRPSCTAWALCYYWSTYTQARDENVDVRGTWVDDRQPPCPGVWNPDGTWNDAVYQACGQPINFQWQVQPAPSRAQDYIASPAFLYPLINHGVDSGTYFTMGEAMEFLNRVGCGSWAQRPHDPWQHDATTWPTENQWIEALRRRTQDALSIDLRNATGLESLKQLLYNGGIAVLRTYQYDNWRAFGNPSCQSNGTCPGINNDVYFQNSGVNHGGHDVTIVGYDDNKTYVDSSGATHAGALLIANSASVLYGTFNSLYTSANPDPSNPDNRGFIWLAYDFVSKVWPSTIAYYNTDRSNYRPRLYAASGISAADRLSVTLRGGTGPTTHARYTSQLTLEGGTLSLAAVPIDPSNRVVVDLTDGLSTVSFTNAYVPLFVELSNCPWSFAEACGATLQNTSFFYDPEGNGINLVLSNAHLQSPDPIKTLAPATPSVRACTRVPASGDVDDNGNVDRTDISLIVAANRTAADCASDPRDLDGNGSISVIDARLGATRCTKAGCAP